MSHGTKYKPFCGRDRARALFNKYLVKAEEGDKEAAKLVFDVLFSKPEPHKQQLMEQHNEQL